VHPDRTVTFRLRAPQATAVELAGEVLQGKSPQPMTKDGAGVWSVTIGPSPPEIWIYSFRIEGVDFPDPANISLMPRSAGSAAVSSFVEVPGDTPAFYDAQPVPHGHAIQSASVEPFQSVQQPGPANLLNFTLFTKDLLANPEQTRKNLRLLFLGAGSQETSMLPLRKRLVTLFKEKGINGVWADYPGGHIFSVWRNHLHDTAPMLFRSQPFSQ
jgi:hypothetical protein